VETTFSFTGGYFHPCSNPDCPGYSDPGEPSYVEPTETTELVCKGCGLVFDEDTLIEYGEEQASSWEDSALEDEADRKRRDYEDYDPYDSDRAADRWERDWDKKGGY